MSCRRPETVIVGKLYDPSSLLYSQLVPRGDVVHHRQVLLPRPRAALVRDDLLGTVTVGHHRLNLLGGFNRGLDARRRIPSCASCTVTAATAPVSRSTACSALCARCSGGQVVENSRVLRCAAMTTLNQLIHRGGPVSGAEKAFYAVLFALVGLAQLGLLLPFRVFVGLMLVLAIAVIPLAALTTKNRLRMISHRREENRKRMLA